MTTDASDMGTLERDGDQLTLRYERRLHHPPEKVWQAITDPAELDRWWGDADVDLDARTFSIRWHNTDDEGNAAVMQARITELDPPRRLEMQGDLHGTLRFDLQPDGDGTVLRFSSTLDLPEDFRTKVLAGWHFHLEALARALDGQTSDLKTLKDPSWEEIHQRYVEADTTA